jgi:hypothetical protein
MIKWKLKTILLVRKRLKFFILKYKIIILDKFEKMKKIKRKYPLLTIIKNSRIFVCEICKLVNPRKDFSVNAYILLIFN